MDPRVLTSVEQLGLTQGLNMIGTLQKPPFFALQVHSGAIGTKGGARVQSLTPGSAAAQAGLQPGDVITELDGRQIHDGTELVVAVRSHSPGDRVVVTFTRNGQTQKATLVLGDNS
jgi:S1-C subfamily serine protease